MNILVTGSGGFVGKSLVERLKKAGHNVEGFSYELGNDVKDFEQCKQAVKGADVVYHLAAIVDETRAAEMQAVNVRGTENMLEASAKANVRQFIYLSTVGVHGNAAAKIDENAPYAPKTEYERTKAKAEKIVLDFQEMLPVTVVRSPLVLGPNEYWAKITGVIRKGYPLPGSGRNRWQVIYIEDLVSALLFVLGREDCAGETFIVAEEGGKTLIELVELIKAELGIKGKTGTVPYFLGVIASYLFLAAGRLTGKKPILIPQHIDRLARWREYDVRKIRALGWKASWGTEQAVRETIRALKSEGKI